MKKFDISRFGKLMKLDLIRNKRSYVYQFLGMLLVFLGLQFMAYYTMLKDYYYTPVRIRSIYDNIYVMFIVVEILFSWVFIASAFTFLNDKGRRISYFLLPATNLEKFLSRLTLHTLGLFVLSLVAYILADLSIVGLLSCFYPHVASGLPYVFKDCLGFFSHGYELMFDNGSFVYGGFVTVVSFLSFGSMMLSLYLLASMLFRKYPFILMSVCVVAFVALFTMVEMENFDDSYAFIVLRSDGYMSLIFIGMTVLFTSLSYQLFKRKGAVNSTFF